MKQSCGRIRTYASVRLPHNPLRIVNNTCSTTTTVILETSAHRVGIKMYYSLHEFIGVLNRSDDVQKIIRPLTVSHENLNLTVSFANPIRYSVFQVLRTMIRLTFVLLLLSQILFGCRIDNALHGVFKRQIKSNRNLIFDSTFVDPIIYDEIIISATSISDFGECYEKFGSSYVLGMKQMGRPICYRCVTPILKSGNILQLAYQQGTDAEAAACHLDGRFSLKYDLMGADLSCGINSRSEVNNCESSTTIAVKFRNCSFPDFVRFLEMTLKCIGSFRDSMGERYIIVMNEESEEYRCGLLMTSTDHTSVFFSKDSSCALLTENTTFEKYELRPIKSEHIRSPCQFPTWIRGEYNLLTVTADWLQYAQIGQDTVAVTSRCVHVNENRILVYSETKCGEPVGYHCLWFSPRSQSLIEFKTTIPQEDVNATTCREYATPSNLQTEDCFNVSVDCDDNTKMKITASQCTTNSVYDSGCLTESQLKPARKPVNSTLKASSTIQIDTDHEDLSGQSIPIGKASFVKSGSELASEKNHASTPIVLISSIFLFYLSLLRC
ncbi:hypothetical protein DICVIV_06594 [Dictyocaulus viviparus]|uniref:Uncharacterized protein n=1 Tax=Dictyocaulus viviparus TaxID=29172 RepID=A0A0D8XRJ5_DICVI|nr:hypothetical protein DICVIV_06594 [Dictyocaulus viviparus]